MDFVVSPIAVALNNHSGGNSALSPGQVVDAVVTRVIDAQHVQLALGSSLVEAKTQVPLLPGMRVQLVVRATPEGMKLVLLRPPELSGASAPRAGLATAAGEAPPAGTPGSAPAAAAPTVSGAPSADPALALAAAMRSAAAMQDGLAPLFADAAVAAKLAGIPLPVREAVLRLLSFRHPVDKPVEADQLRRAVMRSGLFLESNLGSTAAASAKGYAASLAVSDDLKAVLVGLRAALKQWPASEEPASTPLDRLVAQVSTPASAATLRPGSAPAEALYKALLQAASGARAAPDATPQPGTDPRSSESRPQAALPQRPPPPYFGALPAAQPAAHSSITGEASPGIIARTLLAETEAALARHTLLQVASLPERPGLPLPQAEGATLRWMFEIPFGTPQGVAIAQFEIFDERAGTDAEPAAPVWRVRFTIDIETLGAVHAQVAVMGERTAVTLWAEREASAARLRAEAPLLIEGLREAALDPSDVIVREGSPRPSTPPAPAGRFLDRAS